MFDPVTCITAKMRAIVGGCRRRQQLIEPLHVGTGWWVGRMWPLFSSSSYLFVSLFPGSFSSPACVGLSPSPLSRTARYRGRNAAAGALVPSTRIPDS
jgi:hypothetical protein